MATLSEAAAAYAAAGIKVFPCLPRGKTPRTPHGHKDASCNGIVVKEWWRGWPDANIGAPTGENGWTVVDLDMDDRDEIAQFALEYAPPRTPMTRTGKGRQLFFKAEGRPPSVRPIPKVDVRAGESYVILPPSVHPNGKEYKWLVSLDIGLAYLPEHLKDALFQKAARKAPLDASVAGPPIPQGQMQTTLFKMASKLRRDGLDEDLILEHLRRVNKARCGGLLEDDRIISAARSAARYEPEPEENTVEAIRKKLAEDTGRA